MFQRKRESLVTAEEACSLEMRFPHNMHCAMVGVVHTARFFEQNQAQLETHIASADFVGVESDIDRLSNNQQQEAFGFGEKVFAAAWKTGTPVICVNPLAETENAGFADSVLAMTSSAGSLWLLKDVLIKYQIEEYHLNRRDFLKILGTLGLGFLTAISGYGEIPEQLTHGCSHPVTKPGIASQLSYTEYMNTGLLLGLQQLSKRFEGKQGLNFIGRYHINDLRGFKDEVRGVNIPLVKTMHQQNLYHQLLKKLSVVPTVRVWEPLSQENSFALTLREPLSVTS